MLKRRDAIQISLSSKMEQKFTCKSAACWSQHLQLNKLFTFSFINTVHFWIIAYLGETNAYISRILTSQRHWLNIKNKK